MIHLQKTVPDWDQAQARLPDNTLFKAVDQGQQFAKVKWLNPTTKTVLRHHYDTGQQFGGTVEENRDRARLFFSTFVDATFESEIAPHCDFIEEFNEYLANSQNEQEVADRLRWAEAAAYVWKNEYRVRAEYAHIRLALTSAAVGNWIHRGFAVIAQKYDCAISYHPYDHWYYGVRSEDLVPALSMLWDTMEYDWGIKVTWLFTECGPFESAVDGWRSSNCIGFDRQKYVDAVQQWLWDVQQTPAYEEGRIVGFNLFTTGRTSDTWKHFWTEQPELNMLADMVAIEWHPGSYVPPQPPDSLERHLWQVSLDKQVISLNANAALQKVIYMHNYVPVMGEWYEAYNGLQYAMQAAENLGGLPRRVYYCRVGDWNNVKWFGDPT